MHISVIGKICASTPSSLSHCYWEKMRRRHSRSNTPWHEDLGTQCLKSTLEWWDTHLGLFAILPCSQQLARKPHQHWRFLRSRLFQLFQLFRMNSANFGLKQTPKTPSQLVLWARSRFHQDRLSGESSAIDHGAALREEVARDKQQVGWPFGEPPHKPWKPKVAIRNQHPTAIPFVRELQLQCSLNPIEHLKFELVSLHPLGGTPSCEPVDQVSIMRSQGRPHAVSTSFLPQQLLRELQIAFVDLALPRKSDFSRFVVSALHQSNSSASCN